MQGRWLARIIGTRAFRRAQRPQNGLTMTKRDPSSGTIMPQSGPDRRSVLMGTVSSAAAPVIARAAQTEARRVAPPTSPGKPVDIALTINDREHNVAVDIRTSLLDLLRERLGLTGAKRAAITANAVPVPF